jgi:hypothetical protein
MSEDWKGESLISAKPKGNERAVENGRMGNVIAKRRGWTVPLEKRIAHGRFSAAAIGANPHFKRRPE